MRSGLTTHSQERLCPPAHRISGNHVLRHRVFHEAGRSKDPDLAGLHVGLVNHAAYAADSAARAAWKAAEEADARGAEEEEERLNSSS